MNKERISGLLAFAANQKRKEKSYWLKQLSGNPVKASFPFDFERENPAYCLENIHFSLPEGIHHRLIDLSKESSERLFIILMTGIFILLGKYSRNKDILLGIPAALPPGDTSFLNHGLVIRGSVEDMFSFRQLLSKIRRTIIEAENHRNFPIEVLPGLLGMDWKPGQDFPLFDVVVSLRNIHHHTLQEFAPNIIVSFERNSRGIEGLFHFNTGRYKPATIERLTAHYRYMLTDALENPDKEISAIELLSWQEKQQILVSFNDTAGFFPGCAAVHQLVDRQAQLIPQAQAVVYKEERLSYAELKRNSDQMASILRQKGIKADIVAAVLLDHSPAVIVTLLGILKAGGAYLPIDPDYPAARIEYIINDSNSRYIIATEKYQAKVRDCRDKVLLYSQLMDNAFPLIPLSGETGGEKSGHYPGNLAYIIYTSGSTGVPKGVLIEHRSFIDFTTWAVDAFEHCSGYQVLLSNSYASDGAVQQIFPPLVSGGTLHLIDKELRLDVYRYMDYLKKNKINNIDEVPVLMNEMVGQIDPGDPEEKLPDLTCLCLGSEYVPIELARKCRKHLNHRGRIINAYGPAEASVEAAFYHFDGTSDTEISLIGKPRRNTRIYILDETGHCCPIGMAGEICISGVGLARGYINKPELTAEKFDHDKKINQKFLRGVQGGSFFKKRPPGRRRQKTYKTGDLARWLPDGNIEFFGRIDQQIKIRGYRVELLEIEHVLESCPGVKDAAAVTQENKAGETVICAYYVDGTRRQPVIWPSLGEYPLYDDFIYHAMTSDRARNEAYKTAICQRVPGKVVVEIGTGKDAILARFCVEASARKIYAIEKSGDSFKKARQTVEKLGLQEKIVLIHGDATEVDIPEKADVCLSEVIGTIGGSEGAAVILKNAQRFLNKNGIMIPGRCITKIAAVQLPAGVYETPAFSRMSAQYVDKLYRYSGYPFDFRICIDNFPRANVISSSGIFEDLDFSGQLEFEGEHDVELVITRSGRMDGFLLWLNLHTTDGVVIDNLENRHCWAPVFVPVMYPGRAVSVGDRIRLTCSRNLSQDSVNPDYHLQGILTLRNGTDIPIRYDLPYVETVFLKNPFYKKLLADLPAGYAQNIVEPLDVGQLRHHLEERLPSYMVPYYLKELEEIPLTPNGKVDKNALPKPGEVSMEGYVPPRNDLEKRLVTIWAEILNLDPEVIGIHTDFFKAGGHSLLAVVMLSRIHRVFHIKLSFSEIFGNPTISQLAQCAAGASKAPYIPVNPVEKREYYPLSSAQKRLYMIQQAGENSIAYNVPQMHILEGQLDGPGLEKAARKLIQRHESLRTSFEMIENKPVQRIHHEVEFTVACDNAAEREAKELAENFIQPFDLSKAPCFRLRLINLAETKNILMMDMHHIITDGISNDLLVSEFVLLYTGKKLPPLKIRYRDFSQWQNRLFATGEMKNQETYWLKVFQGKIPVLDLPADYERPLQKSFDGMRLTAALSIDETAAVRKYAANRDVTLFMLLLTAFYVLLAKITGQEEIVVGTPVSGRRHTDLEKVIGILINSLALRSFPAGDKTVDELLTEVKKTCLEAFDNQDYPFEELVIRAVEDRDPARNPIFDVMFVLENFQMPPGGNTPSLIKTEEINVIPYKYEKINSKLDMTFTAIEGENNLWISAVYCTSLFKETTGQRIINYYKNILLKYTVEDINIKISGISFLSEQERKQLLVDFNNTPGLYPTDENLVDLLAEQVERIPNSTALVYGSEQLTFKELNQQANYIARLLQSKGIKPGIIVGITAKPSPEMVVGILGVLKAGGAFLPLEPGSPGERINFFLNDSSIRILLTQTHLPGTFKTKAEIINIENTAIYTGKSKTVKHSSGPTDPVYVIYTSGTSGRPKGVLITNRNLVNYVTWFSLKAQLTLRDRSVLVSSFAFDLGYTVVYSSLLVGCQLHLLEKETYLSPGDLLNYIKNHHISFMKLTPSLFAPLAADSLFTKEMCASLRLLVIGGEAIIPADLEKVHRTCSFIKIINHYGPTETTIGSIAGFIDFSNFEEYKKTPTIGKPIHNSLVYILDKWMELLPRGIPGELCISGVGVGVGYCNCPELTAEKFVENPLMPGERMYRTGDLARWLSHGEIEFLGRVDQQVKIRGYRIEPAEIERWLLSYEGIKEAVVIKNIKKTASKSEELYAYMVTDKKIVPLELREYLLKKLPGYMIPSYFIRIDQVPLTLNGKLDRRLLPEPGLAVRVNHIPPRSQLEKELVRIWADVLELNDNTPGIDDNFFDLGGHSLKVTTLVSLVHKESDVKVPMGEIFKNPTIRGLASYICTKEKKIFVSIPITEKKEYYPVSSAQKRMYLLQQLNPGSTSYNKMYLIQLERKADKILLESIFKQLILRHESLRTSFCLIDSVQCQRIYEAIHVNLKIEEYDLTEDDGTSTAEEIIRGFVSPFDLEKVPLLKVGLVKTDTEKYLMMLDLHHITSDGLSMNILVRDFYTLYRGETLPPLKLQYKDFSQWQNRERKNQEIKKQEEYWRKEFSGKLPILNLPLDYPRAGTQHFQQSRCRMTLEPRQTNELRALAKKEKTTLYMVLFSIFNLLLAKITGQEDIIVGINTSGRAHADLQNIVGMFVNTLALRNFPTGQKTFNWFFRELKMRVLEAFENQDYQFDELVEMLGVKRDPSRNPLFNVVFDWIKLDSPAVDGEDSEYKELEYEVPMAKFDLLFCVAQSGEKLVMEIQYCAPLFKRDTITRCLNYFKQIAAQVIMYPEKKLSEIQMMSNEDKLGLLKKIRQKNTQQVTPSPPARPGNNEIMNAEFDL